MLTIEIGMKLADAIIMRVVTEIMRVVTERYKESGYGNAGRNYKEQRRRARS
jgi:hypothetical protein